MTLLSILRSLSAVLVSGLFIAQLDAAPLPPVSGKKLLFVTQLASKERATDDLIRKHLEGEGFAVTLADHDDPASKAEGQDLVLISATVSAKVTAGRYNKVAVPVVTCESNILDDMGMTGDKLDVDFGTNEDKDHYLTIVNAPHPLAAGLPAGTFMATDKDVKMDWGKPGLAASVIAIQPGYPDKATVFGYEKGATMAGGFAAPARRVSFFLYNDAFGRARPETTALFDAALRWATQAPAAKAVTHASAKGRKVLLVVQKQSDNSKAEVREAAARSNAKLQAHLESLGLAVTIADMAEPADRANGQDLVVISSTVKANVLGGRYKQVTVPIVNFENDILDDMGMTAKRREVDFGDAEDVTSIQLINAPHALSAGFAAGPLAIFNKSVGVGFGLPGLGASTIATLSTDARKAVLFGYEKGATMDYDFVAPARRVFLPVDYNAFDQLNDAGTKLVDAALAWALEDVR